MLNLLSLDAIGNTNTAPNENRVLHTNTSSDFYRNTEVTPKNRIHKKDLLPRVKPHKLAEIVSPTNESFTEGVEQHIKESASNPKM